MTITEPAAAAVATTSPEAMSRPTVMALPSTPFLEVETSVVTDRLGELAAALPGIAIHYAVKANPAPEIVAMLARKGSNFDVASPAEIRLCLGNGATADRHSRISAGLAT